MKRLILSLSLCLPLMMMNGCKPATSTTPPAALIPGATSQFDQDTYRALATAHAFAQQASSNTTPLTSAQKGFLNILNRDLNTADTLYVAFHNGAATQAAVQAALQTVESDQSNFANAGVK